ncbi:pyridoxamine 5'-phosphate oxidase family protein [Sulfurospirillum sp.]|nr:pyridoxamine 5'-phosphate oxidase family protein [Sulfurospirillum sp.]
MAHITDNLNDKDKKFIRNQKMFFVSTAPKDGKINLSPKGLDDTFKIVNKNTIIWLNYFGSGNETAAHLLEDNRMTIMFCAFDGKPNILRLYCTARAIQEKDDEWESYLSNFTVKRAARQIFEVTILNVNSSCGMGVPLYEFIDQRPELTNFYDKRNNKDYLKYMRENNQVSFDGKDTKLFKD